MTLKSRYQRRKSDTVFQRPHWICDSRAWSLPSRLLGPNANSGLPRKPRGYGCSSSAFTSESLVSLGPDGYVRGFHMLGDGCIVELGDDVRRELYRYLTSRFGFEQLARPRSRTHDLGLLSLFLTQKRGQFSPNTLAQHFCHLDRHVRQRFTTRRRGV